MCDKTKLAASIAKVSASLREYRITRSRLKLATMLNRVVRLSDAMERLNKATSKQLKCPVEIDMLLEEVEAYF